MKWRWQPIIVLTISSLLVAVSLIVAAIGLLMHAPAVPPVKDDKQTHGMFDSLQCGMLVNVWPDQGKYRIGPRLQGLYGYRVVQLGRDYIVLEAIEGEEEVRIPIHSILSVTVAKKPTVEQSTSNPALAP